MNALDILTSGKTDTELLEAIVLALSADEFAVSDMWQKHHSEEGSNIEIVKVICKIVLERQTKNGNALQNSE